MKKIREERKSTLRATGKTDETSFLGDIDVLFWPDYSHGQCTGCSTAVASLSKCIDQVETFVKIV